MFRKIVPEHREFPADFLLWVARAESVLPDTRMLLSSTRMLVAATWILFSTIRQLFPAIRPIKAASRKVLADAGRGVPAIGEIVLGASLNPLGVLADRIRMNDFIPERDTEFGTWLGQLAGQLAKPGAPQLPGNLGACLQATASAFGADLQAHVEAHAAAASARHAKDASRSHGEALARQAARLLQADPTVTDAQRADLGLPIHDRTRTPISRPQTPPQASIDISNRFRHRIRFRDAGPPVRRARPKGTVGCEVWMYIDAPSNGNGRVAVQSDSGADHNAPEGMQMIALATAPLTVEFTGEQAGHTAHYQLRWINRRGQAGPWSETLSAIIPG